MSRNSDAYKIGGRRVFEMLGLSFVFLGISMMAAVVGFADLSYSNSLFQDLFYIFIGLFILSFLFHAASRDESDVKTNK